MLVLTAGCGSGPHGPAPADAMGLPTLSGGPSGSVAPTESVAVRPPGPLRGGTLSPDVLVFSSKTLSRRVVSRVGRLPGVSATQPFAMAQFYYQENPVKYAAVDPAVFRRWTLGPAAEATNVWKRVADGEIAVEPGLARRIQDRRDYLHMGTSPDSPAVHVGAYVQMFDPRFNDLGVSAVLNQRWVSRLGMVPDNALLISTGTASPTSRSFLKRLHAEVGETASVQILGPKVQPLSVQTAVLTGESVAAAVGTFNYSATAGGQVDIHGNWVGRHIVSEPVPIIGRVTCNKVMIPQLIDVMAEIQQRGLAKDIHSYDGCFNPRFIAGTNQLSYHAFGLAIDLNAGENARGTRGRMNPQIVQIFEKWGFTWGGTWHYTDPMHFQLDHIVKPG